MKDKTRKKKQKINFTFIKDVLLAFFFFCRKVYILFENNLQKPSLCHYICISFFNVTGYFKCSNEYTKFHTDFHWTCRRCVSSRYTRLIDWDF